MNKPEMEQAALFQAGASFALPTLRRPLTVRMIPPLALAGLAGALWIAAAVAYLWGFLVAHGAAQPGLAFMTLAAFAVAMPPLLLVACAWALARGREAALAAVALAGANERLFAADDITARTAARLGGVVRRELDALNAGLDSATSRLATFETTLDTRIAALDEALARVDSRTRTAALCLAEERNRLDALATTLTDSAVQAADAVAERTARLEVDIEAATEAWKAASVALEQQTARLRAASEAAGEAPQTAAAELARQSERLEEVTDAVHARSHDVLARHERHHQAMSDLLARLNDDSAAFDAALGAQRDAFDDAIATLCEQTRGFESMLTEIDRRLDTLAQDGVARAMQSSGALGREVERLQQLSESAREALSQTIDLLRDAGTSAQTSVDDTVRQAQVQAGLLLDDAAAQCGRLLRTTEDLAIESRRTHEEFVTAIADLQSHLLSLPGIARQEAQRVREVVRVETDEILDLSARTLSAVHARNVARPAPRVEPVIVEEPESDGLMGLARKLTQRGRRRELPEGKPWEMSALLAAADTGGEKVTPLRSESAPALSALQALLSDLAIDLDALAEEQYAGEEDWRRYLAGDRSVFARRLARSVSADSATRILALYRDNPQFRDAADAYINEFEGLLTRARDGDGAGFLATTILSADTGKIYLALTYALGRMA